MVLGMSFLEILNVALPVLVFVMLVLLVLVAAGIWLHVTYKKALLSNHIEVNGGGLLNECSIKFVNIKHDGDGFTVMHGVGTLSFSTPVDVPVGARLPFGLKLVKRNGKWGVSVPGSVKRSGILSLSQVEVFANACLKAYEQSLSQERKFDEIRSANRNMASWRGRKRKYRYVKTH